MLTVQWWFELKLHWILEMLSYSTSSPRLSKYIFTEAVSHYKQNVNHNRMWFHKLVSHHSFSYSFISLQEPGVGKAHSGHEAKLTSWTGLTSITGLMQVDRLSLTLPFQPMSNFKTVFSSMAGLVKWNTQRNSGREENTQTLSTAGAQNRPPHCVRWQWGSQGDTAGPFLI